MSFPTYNAGSPGPDAREVRRNRDSWKPLSRSEALRACRTHPVVVMHRDSGPESAAWLTPSNRFYKSDGPYSYSSLRYFIHAGPGTEYQKEERLKYSYPKTPIEALEPLDAMDMAGATLSLASPGPKQPAKPHPIEFQLTDAMGKPMPGISYRVILPDGTGREGKSEKDGFIRLPDNMHPGEAKLFFLSTDSHLRADFTPPSPAAAASPSAKTGTGFDIAGAAEAIPLDKLPASLPDNPLADKPNPLEVLLTGTDGNALPNQEFKIEFADGSVKTGKSDSEGFIRIPDNTKTGDIHLTLPEFAPEPGAPA